MPHLAHLSISPLHAISGALVGLLVGMTGVGGGSLMTPLLILMFGVQPHTAVGTDLLYAATTKTVGTVAHGATKTIDWRVVGRLAAGSIPAAAVTLYYLAQVGGKADNRPGPIIWGLGLALVLTAVVTLFRDQLYRRLEKRALKLSYTGTTIATVALGAVLGVLISLTSVGAGALGMTVLVFLYPELPTKRLVGSDVVHAVPLALLAGLAHWWTGHVNWTLLVSLLAGSIPAVIVGSLLASRAPDKVLRPVLAVVLTIVGVRLLTG